MAEITLRLRAQLADDGGLYEEAADEIERLRGVLDAVTTFHQVTHCHAAARAGLAGLPVGEPAIK